jgi:hypothetical protein
LRILDASGTRITAFEADSRTLRLIDDCGIPSQLALAHEIGTSKDPFGLSPGDVHIGDEVRIVFDGPLDRMIVRRFAPRLQEIDGIVRSVNSHSREVSIDVLRSSGASGVEMQLTLDPAATIGRAGRSPIQLTLDAIGPADRVAATYRSMSCPRGSGGLPDAPPARLGPQSPSLVLGCPIRHQPNSGETGYDPGQLAQGIQAGGLLRRLLERDHDS